MPGNTFILATTTRTVRHNKALIRLNKPGAYYSKIHELSRCYTYPFNDKRPVIETLNNVDVFQKEKDGLRREYNRMKDRKDICLLSIFFPKDFKLTQVQSLQLVKLQIMALKEKYLMKKVFLFLQNLKAYD